MGVVANVVTAHPTMGPVSGIRSYSINRGKTGLDYTP